MIIHIDMPLEHKKSSLRKFFKHIGQKDTFLLPLMCKWFHHAVGEIQLTQLAERIIICSCGNKFVIYGGKNLLQIHSNSDYDATIKVETALQNVVDSLKNIKRWDDVPSRKEPQQQKVNMYDVLEEIMMKDKSTHD